MGGVPPGEAAAGSRRPAARGARVRLARDALPGRRARPSPRAARVCRPATRTRECRLRGARSRAGERAAPRRGTAAAQAGRGADRLFALVRARDVDAGACRRGPQQLRPLRPRSAPGVPLEHAHRLVLRELDSTRRDDRRRARDAGGGGPGMDGVSRPPRQDPEPQALGDGGRILGRWLRRALLGRGLRAASGLLPGSDRRRGPQHADA
jgi:hypothetical protein